MPTFCYEVIRADGSAGAVFEWTHAAGEAPLTHHPESGAPVRRIYTAPNLVTQYSPRTTARKHEPDAAAAKGFSTYHRDRLTGRYHKIAGSEGPEVIQPER